MIPKLWIDKDLEPMVSFTFKGAEAGWMTAKRHKWMCPQGHRSTEYTYNVTIYSSLPWFSQWVSTVSGEGPGLEEGLYRLCDWWPWVSSGMIGLSFPICKGRIMLATYLIESLWRANEIINIHLRVYYRCQFFSQTVFSQPIYPL